MQAPHRVGGYVLFEDFARGGMASVHFGRRLGAIGFSRTVAIKRLHRQHVRSKAITAMLVDEARISARIHHPNVVAVDDVVSTGDELLLVMEYVHGECLAALLAAARVRGGRVPPGVAVAIAVDILAGLHAAHVATDERGNPLGIVHRDVSPQNVLVGEDGLAYVVDFGIARAKNRLQVTREGQVKGKMAYVAPEQLRGEGASLRADLYSVSVILWEMLAGTPLHRKATRAASAISVLEEQPGPLESDEIPRALDAEIARGLAKDPDSRHSSAVAYADALRASLAPASRQEVAEWMASNASDSLAERALLRAAAEALDLSSFVAEPLGSPTTSPPAQSSRRHLAGAIVAIVALGAGAIALAAMRAPAADGERGEHNEHGETPATKGASTASATVPASEDAETAESIDDPAGSAIPATAASVGAARSRPTSGGRASPKTKAPSKATATGSCDPPFSYVNGIKTIKPGCM